MRVYTLGYEGRTLEEFVELLRQFGIQTLVDLRENPFSRKPGFSQPHLAQALEAEGIGYLHLQKLGCPKESRQRYRQTGEAEAFYREVTIHLKSQEEIVQQLYVVTQSSRCCLMCLEREVTDCHRLLVSERLKTMAGTGLEVQHL